MAPARSMEGAVLKLTDVVSNCGRAELAAGDPGKAKISNFEPGLTRYVSPAVSP